MKLFAIQPLLFVTFITLFIVASCINYGKKVTFLAHEVEVYFEGDWFTDNATATGKSVVFQQFFFKR